MEQKSSCRDCADDGPVQFAGEFYCGRCALERLIRALHAEIADDAADKRATVPPVLVKR